MALSPGLLLIVGFGLYGTPVWGTRYGSNLPLAKIDNVRPLCMDFFKQGYCNRKGPHMQVRRTWGIDSDCTSLL